MPTFAPTEYPPVLASIKSAELRCEVSSNALTKSPSKGSGSFALLKALLVILKAVSKAEVKAPFCTSLLQPMKLADHDNNKGYYMDQVCNTKKKHFHQQASWFRVQLRRIIFGLILLGQTL